MQTAIDWKIHFCGYEGWNWRNKIDFLPYLCNAHTHGMEKYHHPDFQVVLNLPITEICRILNTLSLMVKRGHCFHDGELVYSIYEDCPVRLSGFTEGGRKVLRVIIPDQYNQYPENPECDHPYWFQQFETEKLYCKKGSNNGTTYKKQQTG